ncbi:DUF2577 domain-containing protein [Paenibacillus sp. 1P03SA]|uniref:DUF2577 domain-containing protein n=1 Tax=Paenibacillus sp. 1P03SA TaxID=3132294 RepID=UPI0039A39462
MTIKTYQPEGNAASQLVQLIRRYGYNQDVNIELGTILAPPPGIRVQVDNSPIELDAGDVIVSEHLTRHKRMVRINGGAEQELEFSDELKQGDKVIVASADNGQSFLILDRAVMY